MALAPGQDRAGETKADWGRSETPAQNVQGGIRRPAHNCVCVAMDMIKRSVDGQPGCPGCRRDGRLGLRAGVVGNIEIVAGDGGLDVGSDPHQANRGGGRGGWDRVGHHGGPVVPDGLDDLVVDGGGVQGWTVTQRSVSQTEDS